MTGNSRSSSELIELTSDIVAAFVSNNTVTTTDLPNLIAQVHGALLGLGTSAEVAAEEPQKPAVPLKRSISDDFLVCLEDGKKFKSLTRHLRAKYGMTPEDYRAKWGLPRDYPMVAPSYAATRSTLAKAMGLGQRRKKATLPLPSAKGRKPPAA